MENEDEIVKPPTLPLFSPDMLSLVSGKISSPSPNSKLLYKPVLKTFDFKHTSEKEDHLQNIKYDMNKSILLEELKKVNLEFDPENPLQKKWLEKPYDIELLISLIKLSNIEEEKHITDTNIINLYKEIIHRGKIYDICCETLIKWVSHPWCEVCEVLNDIDEKTDEKTNCMYNELQKIEDEKVKLENELESLTIKLQETERNWALEKKNMKKLVKNLKSDLEKKETHISLQQSEVSSLKNSIKEINNILNIHDTEIFEDMNVSLKNILCELEKRDLRQEEVKQKIDKQEMFEEINHTQEEINEMKNRLDRIPTTEDIESESDSEDELKQMYEKRKEKYEQTTKDLQYMVKNMENTLNRMKFINDKISTLENIIKEKDEYISTMKKEVLLLITRPEVSKLEELFIEEKNTPVFIDTIKYIEKQKEEKDVVFKENEELIRENNHIKREKEIIEDIYTIERVEKKRLEKRVLKLINENSQLKDTLKEYQEDFDNMSSEIMDNIRPKVTKISDLISVLVPEFEEVY